MSDVEFTRADLSRAGRSGCLLAAFLLSWLTQPTPVLAQDASQSAKEAPPWARGVPAERRQEAEALYDQGIEQHERLRYDLALKHYLAALERWDHPDYHWNAYLALKNMGRYLEAFHHLEGSMMWGPDHLEPDEWQERKEHRRKLLEQYLAVVEARCDEPDAAVSLNGKPWFVGPGAGRQVVLPGEQVVTARKRGYFTVVKSVNAFSGKRGVLIVAMDRDGLDQTRRWRATWKPWAVAGAGATLVGGLLAWRASRDFAAADRAFAARCGDIEPTCDPGVTGRYTRARWERGFAVGAMITGGVTLAVGATLVLLNRPRSFRTEDRDRSRIEVVPMVLDDGAGVSGRWQF